MYNNNNNFNTCNKCGTANPLMGRFCYQCGGQLKAPQEPIVCTKCNTVNVSGANFCKRCGSKLAKVQTMKYCPQCYTAIPSDSMFCPNCRYDYNIGGQARPVQQQQPIFNQIESFGQQNYNVQPMVAQTITQEQPLAKEVKVEKQQKLKKSNKIETIEEKSTVTVPKKEGKPRIRFAFLIVFTLVMLYLALLPLNNWEAGKVLDFGTFHGSLKNGTMLTLSGYDLALNMFRSFGLFGTPSVTSIITTVLGIVVVLSTLVLAIYIVIWLARFAVGEGCKKASWLMLIMSLISGVAITLVTTSNLVMDGNVAFLKTIYTWFLGESLVGMTWGYNLLVFPVGFLLLFVFSLIFRVPTKSKPAVLDITRPI